MLIGNLHTPRTLVFDHLHRRSEDSEGFKTLPEPVLDCHEDHTRDISESMLANVELLHGRKVHKRILSSRDNVPNSQLSHAGVGSMVSLYFWHMSQTTAMPT